MSTPPTTSPSAPPPNLAAHAAAFAKQEAAIRLGGGLKAIDRQHEKGRMTARERVLALVDPPESPSANGTARGPAAPTKPSLNPHHDELPLASFQELGLWSAFEMYKEHGGAPAAGVVTGIGRIHGRSHVIIANDATVKAGAFFPMTCKKIIRAQTIAMMARLPLVYLVDSAGVFLPMQEDVFPDTDDFGRIFRNNAVISAEGIPQIAAIMGYCVAGGGYLPVLCDTLLMTEGSGLYLAGPALVKAAIGQQVTDEELGGATMHAGISGTIDFREPDDASCIRRLRELVSKYGSAGVRTVTAIVPTVVTRKLIRDEAGEIGSTLEETPDEFTESHLELIEQYGNARKPSRGPFRAGEDVYSIFSDAPGSQYEIRDVIACLCDVRAEPNTDGHTSLAPDFDEYKADYGPSIVCGYARMGGLSLGIVANQRKVTKTAAGSVQLPAVIYHDSADKAARFIMDCNQREIPIVFLHDTTGFMVGKESEQHGIIRAGAKMVNAMSNCVVPKISVILGGSYGAGNYAMCGRAFDPFLTFAWPGSKCAVMGANQATGVLATIEEASRKRKGETIDEQTHKDILAAIHAGYTEQADIRHGAARGWLDRIIQPHRTREELIAALEAAQQGWDYSKDFKVGVIQT